MRTFQAFSLSLPVRRQGRRRLIPASILLLSVLACLGQPKSEPGPTPIEPAEGKKEGRALAAELLAQAPEEDLTNSGLLTIRRPGTKPQAFPVRFKTIVTPTNWVSTYTVEASAKGPVKQELRVIHRNGQPNEYVLITSQADGSNHVATLSENETQKPFAGSDFWLADLGLEFLHWTEQRLLLREMRKGQACEVLESTNPQADAGYARIVSWLETESPHAIVHADAYDAHGQLLKEFDPKKLKKIQGQYQLEEMEIRNDKTGGRTLIEFDLQADNQKVEGQKEGGHR